MKTTPKTGGDATKAGGAVLPVVGWRPRVKCVPEQNFNAGSPKPADVNYWKAINCGIEYACDRDIAQATIDELRAEVERLRKVACAAIEARRRYGWSVEADTAIEALRASLLGDGGTAMASQEKPHD